MTVQAAAKLADVVHMDALAAQGGGATKVGGDDTEGLSTEGIIRAETERVVAETERLKAETEQMEVQMKAGTEGLNAEAIMVQNDDMKTDAETERVQAETERTKRDGEYMNLDAEAEEEKADKESSSAMAECAQKNVDAETLGKDVDPPVQVEGAEEATHYPNLSTLATVIKRKREEALRVAQAGDQFKTVQHLAREIKELENVAQRERARRRIQRQKEDEVLSQALLNG